MCSCKMNHTEKVALGLESDSVLEGISSVLITVGRFREGPFFQKCNLSRVKFHSGQGSTGVSHDWTANTYMESKWFLNPLFKGIWNPNMIGLQSPPNTHTHTLRHH